MSYNWENIIWESKDGTWNRGYYHRISMASSMNAWDDENEYDSEWDDDFDRSYFDYVRVGMRVERDADSYKPTGNPGSAEVLYYKGNAAEVKALDLMAFHHSNPAAKAKHDRSIHNRKRREHFKALEARWVDEALEGKSLRIIVSSDDQVYNYGGSVYVGIPRAEGDWLTVQGKKLYNMKTGKFHGRISTVKAEEPRQRSYNSWRPF